MQIKVRYAGLLRKKMGKREEELVIGEGSSLSDLLDALARTHGENLKKLIGTERGDSLDPTYVVTVNGVLANQLKGIKTRLKNGDEVALMTIISGG